MSHKQVFVKLFSGRTILLTVPTKCDLQTFKKAIRSKLEKQFTKTSRRGLRRTVNVEQIWFLTGRPVKDVDSIAENSTVEVHVSSQVDFTKALPDLPEFTELESGNLTYPIGNDYRGCLLGTQTTEILANAIALFDEAWSSFQSGRFIDASNAIQEAMKTVSVTYRRSSGATGDELESCFTENTLFGYFKVFEAYYYLHRKSFATSLEILNSIQKCPTVSARGHLTKYLHNQMGVVCMKLDKLIDANKLFKMVVSGRSAYRIAHYNRGLYFETVLNPIEARIEFKYACRGPPITTTKNKNELRVTTKNFDFLLKYADSCFESNKEQAKWVYTKCAESINLEPNLRVKKKLTTKYRTRIMDQLCVCCWKLGEFDLSLEYLSMLNNDRHQQTIRKSQILFGKGAYNSSLNEVMKAMKYLEISDENCVLMKEICAKIQGKRKLMALDNERLYTSYIYEQDIQPKQAFVFQFDGSSNDVYFHPIVLLQSPVIKELYDKNEFSMKLEDKFASGVEVLKLIAYGQKYHHYLKMDVLGNMFVLCKRLKLFRLCLYLSMTIGNTVEEIDYSQPRELLDLAVFLMTNGEDNSILFLACTNVLRGRYMEFVKRQLTVTFDTTLKQYLQTIQMILEYGQNELLENHSNYLKEYKNDPATPEQFFYRSIRDGFKNETKFLNGKLRTTDGKIVGVHKEILITFSEYFRGLWCRGFQEARQEINDVEMNFQVLNLVLTFMYNQRVDMEKYPDIMSFEKDMGLEIKDILQLTNKLLLLDLELDIKLFFVEKNVDNEVEETQNATPKTPTTPTTTTTTATATNTTPTPTQSSFSYEQLLREINYVTGGDNQQ